MAEARTLVDDLTQDHLAMIPGTDRIGTEVALLRQLEDAIGSSSGRGSARGVQGSRAPLDLSAVALHDQVSRYVRELAPTLSTDLPLWVRARVALYGVPQEDYPTLVPTLEGWAGAIRGLLDPPTLVPLRGVACGSCHHDQVLLPDGLEAGAHLLAPALVVTLFPRPQADCRVCGQHYDTPALHSLGGSDTVSVRGRSVSDVEQ